MYGDGMGGAVGQANYPVAEMAEKSAYVEKMQTLTVRDNIDTQIARAEAEVERLKGVRDRMAPELLDQRIMDLRQAMNC